MSLPGWLLGRGKGAEPPRPVFEHANSNYVFALPAVLDGLEPLVGVERTRRAKPVRAWWSPVHDAVRPPVTELTIRSALDAERYAAGDESWRATMARGCAGFGPEGGYESCGPVTVPGGAGIRFTVRNTYRNEARFEIMTEGDGGIARIALSGTADDYDALAEIMAGMVAGLRLKESLVQ